MVKERIDRPGHRQQGEEKKYEKKCSNRLRSQRVISFDSLAEDDKAS